ncbi:MAG TPA: glycosyltransferase [Coleofasciculaceae cyanobacterium]
MKITHLNLGNGYRYGGTAVATLRLHQALQKVGITSNILCGYLDEKYEKIERLPRPNWVKLFEVLAKPLFKELGLNDLHNFSSFLLRHSPALTKTDLLHLHCIHHGYFNYLALPYLTAEKPAVYTIHDTWAFTGHCSVNYQCDRWKLGCGQCPDLTILPAVKRDNTHLVWQLKQWVYQHSNLSIVSPSNWVTQQLQESILKNFPIYQIPHGIDTDIFRPLDKNYCRSVLDIPPDKKVIMAIGSDSFLKGSDLLQRAILSLPASLQKDIVLLVMGKEVSFLTQNIDCQIRYVGAVEIDSFKAILYSAADLFLFPTRGETFGLVALESLACRTPVVSFQVGGVPDIVRHGQTGYLAAPETSEELAQGIMQLLDDPDMRQKMGQQGRQMALKEFSIELEAQRYIEVYAKMLNLQIPEQPESSDTANLDRICSNVKST